MLDQAQKLDAVEHITRGLVELAELAIVHRDLKPQNVLYLDGTVRLRKAPKHGRMTTAIALCWVASNRARSVRTVVCAAFAVVLYKIVRSDAVSSTLSEIIRSALHAL